LGKRRFFELFPNDFLKDFEKIKKKDLGEMGITK
jgi:hypothetical protein